MDNEKTQPVKKPREPALDLVRCAAFLYMVALHSVGGIGMYTQPIVGKRMMLMVIMRVAFMSCVPMYVLISGYLLSEKRLSKGYYRGIKKTLGIYLLASAACILFRSYYLETHFDLSRVIIDILGYSAAPYAWYIEMYIGLFLLVPFLNGMYHGLPTKRHKQALVFTVLGVTVLPEFFNTFHFFVKGWWQDPVLKSLYTKLLPAWWVSIWPLAYYFWGVYRKEYPSARRPLYSFLLYLGSVLLSGIFSIYRSLDAYEGLFAGGMWNGYSSLFVFLNTILLFEWLVSIKIPRAPWVAAVLKQLSDLCLGAYLVSYIFDELFYPLLLERVPDMLNRIVYLPLMIILVAACSFALSFVLSCIWKLLERLAGLFKGFRTA